ncbi:hypothetical protein ASD78_10695 [Lysobacter sp. Root667]|uniref:type IV secretion system protein n=1 Tax=Lysobacter sp. Root667 TaxID=1736581 RepID=UPI0006F84489|nr:type IV secretion system protein [Lysobacter sp. Root667]KRA74778.1 hypothetical protein ASD78_10695 [Lysobacter sp. Root667]
MQAVIEWGGSVGAWWDAWSPRVAGVGEFAFFKLVNDYLSHKVDEFGLQLMGRFMAWASGIALTLVTLWILIAGYRIVTGQSREPILALVTQLTRIAVIVGVATSMSVFGGSLQRAFTTDLDQEIHTLFTGETSRSSADAIDENLAYMQVALSAIDAVQVVDGDQQTYDEKTRALLFAGFGTASPPMTAGAMLLLYKFTLALFIGLGPLFILCLIFDQTKETVPQMADVRHRHLVLDGDAERGHRDRAGTGFARGGGAVDGQGRQRPPRLGHRRPDHAGDAAGRDRIVADGVDRDGAAGGCDVFSGDGGELCELLGIWWRSCWSVGGAKCWGSTCSAAARARSA